MFPPPQHGILVHELNGQPAHWTRLPAVQHAVVAVDFQILISESINGMMHTKMWHCTYL